MKYDLGKTGTTLLATFGLAAVVGFADYFGADEAFINALPDSIQEKVENALDVDGVGTGAAVFAGGLLMLGLNVPKR